MEPEYKNNGKNYSIDYLIKEYDYMAGRNTYNNNQYCWENNCKQFPQNIPAEIYCNFDLVFLVRLKFN